MRGGRERKEQMDRKREIRENERRNRRGCVEGRRNGNKNRSAIATDRMRSDEMGRLGDRE